MIGENDAVIKGRCIEITCRGDQNGDTIMSIGKKGRRLANVLRRQKRPVLVLIDLSEISYVYVSARKAAAKILTEFNYDQMAIYAPSPLIQKTVSFIIRAVKSEENVRVFSSRLSAKAWLARLGANIKPKSKSKTSSEYQSYVEKRLKQLNDIISLAVIGEYAQDIPIPEVQDEFTETFVGIMVLIETLEEKAIYISELSALDAAKNQKHLSS